MGSCLSCKKDVDVCEPQRVYSNDTEMISLSTLLIPNMSTMYDLKQKCTTNETCLLDDFNSWYSPPYFTNSNVQLQFKF